MVQIGGRDILSHVAVPSKSGQNWVWVEIDAYNYEVAVPSKSGQNLPLPSLLLLPLTRRRPLKVGSKRGSGRDGGSTTVVAVPSKSGQNQLIDNTPQHNHVVAVPSKSGQNGC